MFSDIRNIVSSILTRHALIRLASFCDPKPTVVQIMETPPAQHILILESELIVKMLYLIGPDGLVNRWFINFRKKVWMTTVHGLP